MKFENLHELTLPSGVLDLAVTPDCALLYAAGMDGRILEVDPASKQWVPLAEGHGSFASGCVLLPGGRTLISAGYDGALVWHDTQTRRAFRRVLAHRFWSWQLALSPDGGLVASATGQYLAGGEKYEPAPADEPTVKVYDTRTGDLVQSFEHLPPVQSVAFSPDGRFLAAANLMGEVAVWELGTGRRCASFSSPSFTTWGIIKSPYFLGGIAGLAFAPGGETLLCCGMGTMVDPMAGNGKTIWQGWRWAEAPAQKIGEILESEQGSGHMETLALLPSGEAFLMAGREAQGTWNAAVFSLGDGRRLASLDTKSRLTRARFSADGGTVYLAATRSQTYDRATREWSPSGRIHIASLRA